MASTMFLTKISLEGCPMKIGDVAVLSVHIRVGVLLSENRKYNERILTFQEVFYICLYDHKWQQRAVESNFRCRGH